LADWSYTVTHKPDGGISENDITDEVIAIPMFTDTGSGEVNEATIILNAVDGQFIKSGVNSKDKIEQYDVIRIEADDGFSAAGTQRGNYDKFFYVMKKQPIKSKDEGVRLQLELLGLESFLQRVQYIKPIFFETPWAVFKDICNLYNAQCETMHPEMPTLAKHDDTAYNKLPTNIENVYEFGVNEDTCFDRMSDIIDSMGASYSAGGVLNFFDLKFKYTGNDGSTLQTQVFSSGNDPDNSGDPGGQTIITIDNSTSVNVGETEGGIDAQTGTQVLAWGATDAGSLPTDFSKFYARQQFLNLFFPNWESGQSYGEDSRVSYDDGTVRKNYLSAIDSNTSTPPANWTQATPASYYGDEITYSPWTGGKTISTTLPGSVTLYLGLNIWKDGAADPTASYGLTDGARPMFWDHNLVINDGTFWRTYVDVKARSDEAGTPSDPPLYTHGEELPPQYLYDENRSISTFALRPYRGFKVLCTGDPIENNSKWFGYDEDKNGSAATASTVVDVNKKLIANSVLEYDGTQWKVFARPYKDQFNDNSDPVRLQVSNIEEAKIYRFYKDESNETWQNQTDDDMGNDCFHPVYKNPADEYVIRNYAGALADWSSPAAPTSAKVPIDVDESTGPYSNTTGNGPPWGTKNADSAIASGYFWHPKDELNIDMVGGLLWGTTVALTRKSVGFYGTGAWLSLKFPLPNTCQTQRTDATLGTYVGDIYGGGTNTGNPHEPATVDTQNMHFTHDGKRGFNNSSAEDFGQINSISFNIMVTYQQDAEGDGTFKNIFGEDGANFKMRCCLIDTSDNVVVQDFTVFFNNFWQAVSLPISGFEIFKGREPRYATSAYYNFMQPKGIDVQNIFIWRNLKMISIYTLDPYDEVGRYSPMAGRFCNTSFPNENRTCSIVLDALRFTKPLLTSTEVLPVLGSDVLIQSDFLEKPEIGNYEQLLGDVEAERQKQLFQRVEYDVTTSGKIDIGFGDYFNLADSEIVPAFTDPTESAGSVKLVAKRIEYSISKPLNGKGGFLRRIRGVRRFT